MNPRFLPTHLPGKLDRIVEEASEVIQAVGKSKRFSLTSTHPDGGPNNAALILSEIADLRYALSVAEEELIARAAVKVGDSHLLWTTELITAKELKELLGDEDMSDYQFLSQHKVIGVCAGQWHREGMEYWLYKDPGF
jgi:hypothetical protein